MDFLLLDIFTSILPRLSLAEGNVRLVVGTGAKVPLLGPVPLVAKPIVKAHFGVESGQEDSHVFG